MGDEGCRLRNFGEDEKTSVVYFSPHIENTGDKMCVPSGLSTMLAPQCSRVPYSHSVTTVDTRNPSQSGALPQNLPSTHFSKHPHSELTSERIPRAGKMTQWVKHLPYKLDGQSLILGTYLDRGENQLHELSSEPHTCAATQIHLPPTLDIIHKNKKLNYKTNLKRTDCMTGSGSIGL